MRKRKLFYVPGLISLIGLPIMLFMLSLKDVKRENSLGLNLISDELSNNHPSIIYSLHNALKGKKIEQVFLNDYINDEREQYQFERKLIFIQTELERLQFIHDTSIVLKIKLGEENTYGQFVNLVNLAVIYGVRRYAYVNDDFYFFANEPRDSFTSESVSDLNSTYQLYHPSAWDIFSWKIEYGFLQLYYGTKQNLLLSIGFAVLIVVPFIVNLIRKKNLSSL